MLVTPRQLADGGGSSKEAIDLKRVRNTLTMAMGQILRDQRSDSPLTIPHDSHGRFFNPGIPEHGFRELLKWMGSRHPGLWQSWIPHLPGRSLRSASQALTSG